MLPEFRAPHKEKCSDQQHGRQMSRKAGPEARNSNKFGIRSSIVHGDVLIVGPDRRPMQAALQSGQLMQVMQNFFSGPAIEPIYQDLDRSLGEDAKDLPYHLLG